MSDDELPEGWRSTDLGTVIDGFETGRNLQASGSPAKNGEYGVLKISAVTWGQFNPNENKALLPGDKPKPHETVRKGDLLITRANTTALVGAVVRVNEDYPHLMLPDKILRIRYRTTEIDPEFLMQSLRTTAVREYFEENATGTSDSMRNLSQPKLEAAPLALPSLPEQRRIVAKLESLQARSRRAREALEAVPPLLEKLRQSILAAAFRGDLTKDWREKHPDVEPASELLKRIRVERRKKWEQAELAKMKAKGKAPTDGKWKLKYVEPEPVDESELPELPAGWGWLAFDELAFDSLYGPRYGADQYASEGYPTLRTTDLNDDGEVVWNNPPRVSITETEYIGVGLRPNDFVVTRTGATIGKCALFRKGDERALPSAYLIRFGLISDAVNPEYVLQAALAPSLQTRMRGGATATAQPNINARTIGRLPVPIAPTLEQYEVVRRITTALRRVSALDALLTENETDLGQLDSAILSKAFRGELVPQEAGDAAEAYSGAPEQNSPSVPRKTNRKPNNGRK